MPPSMLCTLLRKISPDLTRSHQISPDLTEARGLWGACTAWGEEGGGGGERPALCVRSQRGTPPTPP